MDKNILKIDLDMKSQKKAVILLKERLAYMHDLRFFNVNNIKCITLIKKSSYGAKIYLNYNFPEHFIVIFQLLLGSDWMKETNTCINHYMLNMEYSNRLFDIKRYREGIVKKAHTIDITDEVILYVKKGDRIKKSN